MLSFKLRELNEDEIVRRLKTVLEACDADELKSKKFVGLLNDHIPYQQGLKLRLELIAKNGYIEEMQKLKRSSDTSVRTEKMALQFSKAFGFVYEESYASFNILAKAMSLNPAAPQGASLKIVNAVQSGQGNFSKKHLPEEKNNTNRVKNIKPVQTQIRKRFIRNKANLILYLIYLLIIPIGFYVLQNYFGNVEQTKLLLGTIFTYPVYVNEWFVGTLIATGVVIVLPYAVKWTFKMNLLGFYPLVMLLVQALLFSVQPNLPQFYALGQIALGIVMLTSFAIIAFYSMRLPKGAYEYTAYRAIVPYYLSGAIWLAGQYVLYANLM
ncbi:MAG TPA: hypothetical protein DCS67_01545 [Clostridiales bacterium UBA8960]|jgi:hypothetical protein|nr:hypothetical protein [Clostridiales bacterium UBA8960]